MTTQNAQTGPVAEERPPAPPGAAGERLAELPNPAQIDALLADAEAIGISIDGRTADQPDGQGGVGTRVGCGDG